MERKEKTTEKDKNIIICPQLAMPKLRGLGSTLFYKMLEHKDKISVTCGHTAHNETYEQLLKDSILVASTMRRKGIKPNDVISICSHNYPDCLSVYCASLFLGAISANIDPDLSISDIAGMLTQIRPKMIFVDSPHIKLMKLSLRKSSFEAPLVVFGDPEMNIPFSQFFLSSPEKDFIPVEIENLKETACVVFTSDVTGVAKGVCLTHYGLLGHIYSSMSNIQCGLKVLIFSNLYWLSSITVTIYSIINGCNQVLFPNFDPDFVWNLITEHQPITGICKNGRPENADTSALQFVFLTGDPISKEQEINHVRKYFPDTLIMNSYGLTEQNGSVLAFTPTTDKKLMEEKPNSVGKPIPGYSYKIVDTETKEILGPNQEGELRIKSEFSMNGYYKTDSSHVWDSDGFFKTGDMAYYDNDHCFFIKNRIKDSISYLNSFVSPG